MNYSKKTTYNNAILLIVFLLYGCNKNSQLLIQKVNFQPQNIDESCFIYYYDRFGDKKYELLADDRSLFLDMKTYFPTSIFLGSSGKIHQPILMYKNSEDFIVQKEGLQHIFMSSKNHCNDLFFEKSEREFGYSHLGGNALDEDSNELYWLESENWFTPEYALKRRYTYKNLMGDKWLLREQLKYLKNYNDTCTIDSKYRKVFTQNFKDYFVLKTIIKTLTTQTDSLKKDHKLLKEIYSYKKRMRNEIDLSKGVQLHARRLIYYYNIFLSRESMRTQDEFTSQWANANKEFRGQSKEFLLFLLLKKYMRRSVKGYENYLSEFRETNKDRDYTNYIDSMYKKNNHYFEEKELEVTLNDSLNNSHTLRQVLDEHKGKIIYLDFWASWCMPCRASMAYYPELKDSLNRSDISFVFISIDEKEDAWKLAINKTKTTNYEHYILKKDSELFKFFNLSSIPRHAIINKEGKLVSYNAPRPEDLTTLTKILNNLK
jgi:thiol-disulfide isomerase/thioredoxin